MNHEKYMHRCIELAQNGKGTVSPNPLVGSVIVYQDKIIGEGYHHHCGGHHAEVMAINSVKDKSKLKYSRIYVTLEPCSHYGNTPPCANLILKHKIPKVIISCRDPHEKVAGKGIQLLSNNGVEVIENVLKDEGEWLNRRFFTFHRKKRPYIILKWAQTQDGFIDIYRKNDEKGIHWITQPETKLLTHKWRAEEDAILIGRKTVTTDNPSLTVRNYQGNSPIRIVIDKSLKISKSHKIYDKTVPTILFNSVKSNDEFNLTLIKIGDSKEYVNFILQTLYLKKIQSIIIEGGAKTLSKFIEAKHWDEARILVGKTNFIQGIPAPTIRGKLIKKYNFGCDKISILINRNNVNES